MKIFLTGSTGFIGSHIINAASNAGIEILACRQSTRSLSRIPLSQEPIWINRDLTEISPSDLEDCNVIIHCAASGVGSKNASIEDMIRVNVLGTSNLLECASQSGASRVIIAGSCHEYGAHALGTQPIETDLPLRPTTFYGSTKAAGFHLAVTHAFQHNLELYYGRVFSAYGTGQSPSSLWSLLHQAAISNQDFLISQGNQIRDFIPVYLVVEHLLSAAFRDDIARGVPVIANIATGNSQSVFDFVKQEWIKLGATGRILRGALSSPKGDPPAFVASLLESRLTFGEYLK